MRKFNYEGVDKNGRTVRGTTAAESPEEVKAQLREFGFKDIEIKEKSASVGRREAPEKKKETLADDFARKFADDGIDMDELVSEEDEGEEDEWRRLEVLAKVRQYRRKENIIIAITLIILGTFASHYIYNKTTEIPAPQPKIIMRSDSGMLSFRDAYVRGNDLVFIVFAKNWNGNVRVGFKAWDPFEKVVDFGTARLGFIGDHFGGSPEKSGTFRLKKTRYYETIEIRVSGDEGK